MTWTLGIAIAALVIAVIDFCIGMSALDAMPENHKNRHDSVTEIHNKHDVRISVLEKYIKKIRKAVDNG